MQQPLVVCQDGAPLAKLLTVRGGLIPDGSLHNVDVDLWGSGGYLESRLKDQLLEHAMHAALGGSLAKTCASVTYLLKLDQVS